MRKTYTAIYLSLAALTLSSPALAQSSQEDRLQKLEKSLNTLEQQVYKSGSSSKEKPSKSSGGGNSEAQFDARMGELEERMRTMNGKLEEMEFSLRSFAEKLDKIIADVDIRVSTLEKKIASNAAAQNAKATEEPAHELSLDKDAADEATSKDTSKSSDKTDDTKETKPTAKDTKSAQGEYDRAFNLLRQGKYEDAEKALTQFIATHKDSKLVGNSYYWLGETFYMRKNYEKAAVQFMKGYQQFPKASKAPDNLLKLGMSLSELKKTKEACTTFKKLTQEFGDDENSSAERAKKEMTKLKCENDAKETKAKDDKSTKKETKAKPTPKPKKAAAKKEEE